MNNAASPLEDTWVDVLNKAKRGQELSEADLAESSGLTREEVLSLLQEKLVPDHLKAVAQALGIAPDQALALARGEYHPGPINLPAGMAMFTTDWGDMKVHSYLTWDIVTREAIAFDTGADATEMLDFLRAQQLNLRLLLLTHGHGDHLFDLDRIIEKTGAEAWIGEGEGVSGIATFAPGKEFQIGNLRVSTRLTKGHAPGGITYIIHGPGRPVAVVGDAIFAGSMGGPKISYADCLRTNREEILSLPPQTILCPGHGPLTTVALEKEHNPFFP